MYLEEMYSKHRQEELRKRAEDYRLLKSVRANHSASWKQRTGKALMRTAVRLLQTDEANSEICVPVQSLEIASGKRVIQLQVSTCPAEG